MIYKLENNDNSTARQIYTLFQNAYKVEAALIGVPDVQFPPLQRTVEHINHAPTSFFGYFEGTSLAGLIEVTYENTHLEIDSLIVNPDFFRRGIAGKLIDYVLSEYDFHSAQVETAQQNLPAINLYQKHGFCEFKKWVPAHGIPKVALRKD
jgi:ribosomal protein S18 acetylase RimI-like enzyme